jgi:hypothetical protein
LIPVLMAAGVALTVSNTRAVMEALCRVQTAFARTPKFAIEGSQKVTLQASKYRSRAGFLPYIELAIGTYFLGMMAFAVDTYNFLALPFLAIFVSGYYWAGCASLWQDLQGRLRWRRQRKLELGRSAATGL